MGQLFTPHFHFQRLAAAGRSIAPLRINSGTSTTSTALQSAPQVFRLFARVRCVAQREPWDVAELSIGSQVMFIELKP